MTQTLDLNKMGLMPMSNLEMIEVDGGELPWWAGPIGALAWWVADNWDDLTEGAKAAIKQYQATHKIS